MLGFDLDLIKMYGGLTHDELAENLSMEGKAGGASWGYTLLAYLWKANLGLAEDYALDFTGVKGSLIFEDGKAQVFNLGDTFDIANAMSHDANHDGQLTAQVAYTPRATLNQTLSLSETFLQQLLVGNAHAEIHGSVRSAAKAAGLPTSFNSGWGYNSDKIDDFPHGITVEHRFWRSHTQLHSPPPRRTTS